MKPLITALLICIGSFHEAHAQNGSLQKEINEQVWKPFILAFNNDDDAGFKAVHSKEVIRVERDANHIFGFDQYFKKVPDSVKAKWGKQKKILSSASYIVLLPMIRLFQAAKPME